MHAHPDDETLATGATMARYVAEGAQVTLVTCTAGEEGEILLPEISHLDASRDDGLGAHRVEELAAAMAALGVTDHRLLGGPFHFRDSGMQWGPDRRALPRDETRDDTFWRADLLEASALMAEVIREVRPQVLITYDEFGAYGHPDHIQANRVAHYGASLAAAPPYRPDLGPAWDIEKIYWIAPLFGLEGAVPDDVTAVIAAAPHAEAKLAALRSHPSQMEVDGPFMALAEVDEYFRIVKGVAAPGEGQSKEDDLFAGVRS